MFTKKELVDIARSGIITVEFTKRNGTSRVLEGTLDFTKMVNMPSFSDAKRQSVQRNQNPDIVTLFDVVNEGWRSIRIDSISLVKS